MYDTIFSVQKPLWNNYFDMVGEDSSIKDPFHSEKGNLESERMFLDGKADREYLDQYGTNLVSINGTGRNR
jgi:hypothetical protein